MLKANNFKSLHKPKKFRILLIQDFLSGTGGTESYVYSLKELLEQDGHTVQLFGSLNEENLSSFLSRWYSFKFYRELINKLEEFKPDIVHVHHIYRNLSPSVLRAAKKFGVPVIQTIHGYNFVCPKVWMINDKGELITKHDSFLECLLHHLPKKNLLYSILKQFKVAFHQRIISKNVDHFICPSKQLFHFYEEKYPGRVSYVPNFVLEKPKYKPLPTTPSLLFVGRLSYDKGVEILLDAFDNIVRKHPSAELTIVGDGPERDSLLAMAVRLGFDEKVKFIGNVKRDRVLSYYKKALVVILPSICTENCPITAIEAVITRRPIIASNVGGFLDIIKDNKTGFLFERGNSKSLSTKILKMLNNPKLGKQFSVQQKHLIEEYGPSKHLKKIIKIYNFMAEL